MNDNVSLVNNAGPAGHQAIDMSGQPQQQPQDEGLIRSVLKQSSHPNVMIFHVLFRFAAIFTYLFGSLIFNGNFVLVSVLCILFLAFDFWTVKNVSGRLLVGLRWWNEIKDDGSSQWIFESRPNSQESNKADSRVFWYSLYLTTVVWILFGLACILTFKLTWLVIVGVAISLNTANIVGFTKCEKDAKAKLQSMVAQGMMGSLFSGTSFLR